MIDRFSAVNKRSQRRAGRDATIVNRVAQTDPDNNPVRDDYGNMVFADESQSETKIDLAYRGTPQFERRESGIDSNIDMVAWIDDDETVTTGEDDETVSATRIADGHSRYVVRNVYHERNGTYRVHGERE